MMRNSDKLIKFCINNFIKYEIINNRIVLKKDINSGDNYELNRCILYKTSIDGYLSLSRPVPLERDDFKEVYINGFANINVISLPENAFKGGYIRGQLDLGNVTSISIGALDNTIIDGNLNLFNLEYLPDNVLNNAVINGNIHLNSLKSASKNALKNTYIKGEIFLSNTKYNLGFLNRSVKKIQYGYDKEHSYCYIYGFLKKILDVQKNEDHTVYVTPFGYIVTKGHHMSYKKTVEAALKELDYKYRVNEIRNTPIESDTLISTEHYIIITEESFYDVASILDRSSIPYEWVEVYHLGKIPEMLSSIKASEFLSIYEKNIKNEDSKIEKFKKLCTFNI